MNECDDDIRWISHQRPAVAPPDPVATSQARSELLRHAARSARPAPVAAAPSATRPRGRRIGVLATPRRGIAMAAAVTVAAVVTATLAVAPRPGPNGIGLAVGPGVANAQTLVLLANHVSAAPRRGDATLVFHRNVAESERPFTGADLYLDDGRYYYAMTPAGLPAAVESGPQHFSLKRVVDAIAAVSSADPRVARAAFLKAADPLWGGDIQHETYARQDNVIWVSGIDVLGAAYGRPSVLAGVLRALATVRGVTVTHSTSHGVRTLEIAMKVPARAQKHGGLDSKLNAVKTIPAHLVRATLSARTGAMMRYTDLGLTVTYHVSRVNAARYGVR